MVLIRKYNRNDRKTIIEICHKTGYMGGDAKGHFDDSYLFGLLYCIYYVDYEPENCFVAEDGKTGSVIGYVLSSLDSRKQEKQFQRIMIPKIIQRAFFFTLWRHYNTFRTFIYFWKNAKRESPIPDKEELLSLFPAHLHIDILPSYHGKGIGTRLIQTLESYLKTKGVIGIHLGTSERNSKAVFFYRKNDYEIFYQGPSGFGMWPDASEVRSLIFAKKLTI